MTRHYVVPGRVELVGKHVDYAGGRSLTCAVDLVIEASATPLRESVIRVSDVGRRGVVEAPLRADAVRTSDTPGRGAYVVAVARRLARDFPHATTGVDLRLRSTLPASAGLSSSSALIVAIGTALVDANDLDHDPHWRDAVPDAISRAEYFGAMETGAAYRDFPGDEGVGVRGGAQDHVAIVCAEAESVGQFAYLPARLERRVPWPTDYELLIGVSGVTATKTGNARARYNRASDATRALVRAWNADTARNDATLAAALASGADAPARFERLAEQGVDDFPATYLVPRLAQFREEIDRIVPDVGDALRDRDFTTLGRLVDRSQELAEQALGNQIAETIHLARTAREHGAVAASAFGAGFGGAVWAMVRSGDAARVLDAWRGSYLARFPERADAADFLRTRPSGPAREVAPA
ncbi:MAG: Galactokinase [Gemmatimonadetes bacterium]|nr:Galactokinase [Gemmatimonadota bacterium]